MDSSTYVPSQPNIIQFTDPTANVNDQPVNYGSQLFDVMNAVSDKVGGVEYLIGKYATLKSMTIRDTDTFSVNFGK